MREIKHIGLTKRGNDSRNYRYSVFECPSCNCHIEKKTKDGLKSKYCSHACYAVNRERRGKYKPYVMISGYKYLYKPEHIYSTKSGYVAEHRLVVEEFIGRPISGSLDVHHINLDKTDNRISNLIVLTKSQHMKLHKYGAKKDETGKFTI